MLSTLSNLLLHKQMVFGDGKIEILGQPVVLNALLTEVGIMRELETRKLEHIIYYSAKAAGHEWFKGMSEKYGLKPQDIMKWGPELINLAGWGIVKPVKADLSAGELEFFLVESTFAKHYGKADHPVDHYFRGLVTGAWENACAQSLDGIELECASMGVKTCKFKLCSREKLDLSDPSIKRQLGL